MIATNSSAGEPLPAAVRSSTAHVIGASCLGTLFEWYDFYLYGALASTFAAHFFSAVNETTAFILALATFAVGFLVRPVGAILFGRLGDRVGRKVTFLATLAIMGLATFLVGVLPDYGSIGIAAPLLLVTLRALQGLAIGGEFGGAIVYVAEHAPDGQRGLHTSFIPAMAMSGLILSLVVIGATRGALTAEQFSAWGWRIPFLVSLILLGVSLWIRLRLQESPVFQRMREERSLARAPVAETFLEWRHLKLVLAALFGCVVGQAVLFYVGTFYAFYFLERVARIPSAVVTLLTGTSVAIATPVAIASGWLSDRIGRKPLLLAAVALAALLYFPLFGALLSAANPALARALETAPVVLAVQPDECTVIFDPLGRAHFDRRPCDVVRSYLAHEGIGYRTEALRARAPAHLSIGEVTIPAPDEAVLAGNGREAAIAAFQTRAQTVLETAGYRGEADPASIDRPRVVAILVALLILTAMSIGVYGAQLAEIFPARIRYTAASFPQNVGNGWFGGLLPAIAFSIVAASGNVFAGLWYPVGLAILCFFVCWLAVPETRGRPIV